MLTIDIQRLLCTVIKFHVVKGAKGPTIRKLMWGVIGGGGEVQKKYSRKGKLNEKNSCTPINPKNIHAMVSARGSVMILRRAPIDSIET